MASVTNGTTTFSPAELATTFVTYREQLNEIVFHTMAELLQHVSVAQGIRYQQIHSSLQGKFQMGNYKKDKLDANGVEIKGRRFETFFGNAVESIDPNAIYQSIWGSNITKGDALKGVPFVRQVAAYIVKSIWENVLLESFTAAHDASDTTTTAKWFNGFKTIIEKDMTGDNYVGETLIDTTLTNLFDLSSYKTGGSDTAITAENAEDVFKEFFWQRDAKLRGQKNLKLFVNDLDYHKYTEAYQAAHGALPYNQTYDKRTLEGASNVEIVPLHFVPQDFMLLTPKSNIFCLYNQKTADEGYIVERSLKNHYDVDVVANAFFGTQFESVDKSVFSCALIKA